MSADFVKIELRLSRRVITMLESELMRANGRNPTSSEFSEAVDYAIFSYLLKTAKRASQAMIANQTGSPKERTSPQA